MLDIARFMEDGIGGNAKMIKSFQTVFVPSGGTSGGNNTLNVDISPVVVENTAVLAMASIRAPYIYNVSCWFNEIGISSSTVFTVKCQGPFPSTLFVLIEFHSAYVKSSQKGVGQGEITISEVNPEKCIASSYFAQTTGDRTHNIIVGGLTSLTATKINVTGGYGSPEWRVLELK